MASGKQIISLLVPGYSRLRTKLLLCYGAMGSDGVTFTVNYCRHVSASVIVMRPQMDAYFTAG